MRKQIIIADDDPDDRLIYDMALREVVCEDEYRIEFAHNGADVIKRVQGDARLPAMIFLDLNMPMLDGRQCLRQLRAIASRDEMPVVILSTSGSEKDIKDTFSLGANLYIQKPTDFNSVKDLFFKCLCTSECIAAGSTMDGYLYKMTP